MTNRDQTPRDPGGAESHAAPKTRHPVISLLVLAISIYVVSAFWDDFVYFLSDPAPLDLGTVNDNLLPESQFPHNRLVRVRGLPDPRHASGKVGRTDRQYSVLIGSWIIIEGPPAKKDAATSGEFEEITAEGRLLKVSSGTRFKEIRQFFSDRLFAKMPKVCWLLQSGKRPRQDFLIPLAVLITAAIALLNIFYFVRAVRERCRPAPPLAAAEGDADE